MHICVGLVDLCNVNDVNFLYGDLIVNIHCICDHDLIAIGILVMNIFTTG